MKTQKAMPPNKYLVAPVWKAMSVLEFIAESGRSVSLTEVSSALGLPKTTAFRYLQTLSATKLLHHNARQDRYELGSLFRVLAKTDNILYHLRTTAVPIMKVLNQEFNETINLAIEAKGELVYIEVFESSHNSRIQGRIGWKEPFHTTALGKVFLAYMDDAKFDSIVNGVLSAKTYRTVRDLRVLRRQLVEVRNLGYSIEVGENEDDAVCIGVPIFDGGSTPVAALSISIPVKRQTFAFTARATVALKDAGYRISSEMIDFQKRDCSQGN